MADYSINAVPRKVSYTGSAGLGPYGFTFEILDENDVAVYFNTTLLTLTTDYTVTINANGTGSITIVTGSSVPSTPDGDDQITIIGARDIERTTDFVTAGDLRASALNEQLDSLTIFDQQLSERADRALSAPEYDPTGIDMTLPAKADRLGTVLGFNATTGNPEAGPTIADVASLASITADIATLADIEDGTDATDAIQTVAGISTNVTTVASVSSNVTTVAGNTTNINTVATDLAGTDTIGTVATNIASVNTVATNIADVITVANDLNEALSEIETAADDLNEAVSEIDTVAVNIANVNAVGENISDVNAVATDLAGTNTIGTVAGALTNINTVATNIADVNNFADVYRISSTAPSTSLDEGDLWYDSTNNIVKYYDGLSWSAMSPGLVGDTSPELGGTLSMNNHGIYGYGTIEAWGTSTTQDEVVTSISMIDKASGTGDEGKIVFEAMGRPGSTLNEEYPDLHIKQYVSGTTDALRTRMKFKGSTGYINFYDVNGNETFTYNNEGRINSTKQITSEEAFYANNGGGSTVGTLLAGASEVSLGSTSSNDVVFLVGNLEKARLTSDGYLGIGTDSPATALDVNGTITANEVTLGDNEKATFGAGSDLQIYHDSDVSYIKEGNATGSLQIWCKDFEVYNAGGTETLINADVNAGVQLYYDNSQKLSTTSTGIDVTGTATMDGLTVDGGTGLLRLGNGDTSLVDNQEIGKIEFYSSDSSTNSSGATFEIVNRVDGANWFAGANPNELLIRQTGTSTEDVGTGTAKDRLLISKDGDISFYEDTGTTAKFFWDASAESLGIGTSSPQSALHIAAADNSASGFRMKNTAGESVEFYYASSSTDADFLINRTGSGTGGDIGLKHNGDVYFNAGNVGIGTSSPSSPLHVNTDTVNSELFRLTSASATLKINEPTAGVIQITSTGSGDSLAFATVGSERARIDSSGNVGIGTSSPGQELHVQSGTGTEADIRIAGNGGASSYLDLFHNASGAGVWNASNTPLQFATNGAERMRITSAGRLGLGESSPDSMLHINSDGDSGLGLTVETTTGSNENTFIAAEDSFNRFTFKDALNQTIGHIYAYGSTYTPDGYQFGDNKESIQIVANGSSSTSTISLEARNGILFSGGSSLNQQMILDADGNLGIGTSSPSAKLDVGEPSDPAINMDSSASGHLRVNGGAYSFAIANNGTGTYLYNNGSGRAMVFGVNETERMRLDASGNLLVGKTTSSTGAVGAELRSSGVLVGVRDGLSAAIFNRLTSDGEIISIRKDGTTVGSIGTASSNDLYISDGRDSGLKFDGGNDEIIPCTSAGATNDATQDLGNTSSRFKDLYLSGGVYLGGTGASNYLDDYEDGTFTPVFSDSSSAGNNATPSTLTGNYVKVGRLVHYQIIATNIDTTGMTGTNTLFIKGLPFTVTSYNAMGSVKLSSVTFSNSVVAQAQTGTGYVRINDFASASGSSFLTVDALSSGTADILITGTYYN